MFAEKFLFNGNAQFAEVLYYGCRNPMLHSFTLHQAKRTMSLVDALPTAAIWRATSAHWPNHFVISVKGLFTAFAGAVHAFEAAVRSDATLQEKFERMFPNYGSIAMWSAVLEPASVNVTDSSPHR
jgi:hypothetical protein